MRFAWRRAIYVEVAEIPVLKRTRGLGSRSKDPCCREGFSSPSVMLKSDSFGVRRRDAEINGLSSSISAMETPLIVFPLRDSWHSHLVSESSINVTMEKSPSRSHTFFTYRIRAVKAALP